MTKQQAIEQINAQQEALEAEEHKLATELYYVKRSLEHLRRCRHELTTGKQITRTE